MRHWLAVIHDGWLNASHGSHDSPVLSMQDQGKCHGVREAYSLLPKVMP